MNILNLIAVSLCLLFCIAVPIVVILKYRKVDKMSFKYFLYGLGFYVIIRILLYPFLYVFLKNTSLIVKIMVDIIYIAGFSVAVKIFLYNKYQHKLIGYKERLVSFGIGEALAEITFVFLPVLLNRFLLMMTIEFGDIYSYFGEAYPVEFIDQMIVSINQISITYYLWIAVAAVSLLFTYVYISLNLNKFKLENWVFVFCFYTNYLLVPVYSYGVSLICLCILNVYAFKSIKLLQKG